MKSKITTAWLSFPVAHKKRFFQGLAGYGLLCGAVAIWLSVHTDSTVKDWQSRIPFASTAVKDISPKMQSGVTAKAETIPVSTTPEFAPPPPVLKKEIYVSIIVSDMGLSSISTKKALNDLPSDIVLAFSPYAENLQTWLEKAKNLNHETLLQLPMEDAAYPKNDPGPKAISSRISNKDNNDNLKWLLAQGKGTIGMINFMGTRLLINKKKLSYVFNALQKNNLIFIETPGIKKSAGKTVAKQNALPYLVVDLQIDATATDEAIQQQLEKLETIARKRGSAVGIAAPYPITLNALKLWTANLEKHGITLTPLSMVWENNLRYDEAPQPPQEQLRQP